MPRAPAHCYNVHPVTYCRPRPVIGWRAHQQSGKGRPSLENAGPAAFTESDMTQEPINSTGYADRRRRLPLVATLVLGLLLSLFHCANCDLAFAGADSATIASNLDTTPSHDGPGEQQLPAHSGHCLSHVAAQSSAIPLIPMDLGYRAFAIGCDQSPASVAGLPLFKPPRA
jgi:hypothetical protein